MRSCPKKLQIVLLLLGAIHMLGVLAEPLRFFSRSDVGVAPEFELLAGSMQSYSQWLYLDHGYFFFAPNPGPGRLIQCDILESRSIAKQDKAIDSVVPDSSAFGSSVKPVSILLPDKKKQWPRLLYHRYLMLAEFYNSRFAPKQISTDRRKDAEYQQLQDSMIKSLKHQHRAVSVELMRIERSLPTPYMVLTERVPLDDPRLVDVLPETMLDASVQELPAEKTNEPNAQPE
jgi:hypothetical protein